MVTMKAAVAMALSAVAAAAATGASAAPRVLVESRFDITEVVQDAGRIAFVVERPNPHAKAGFEPECATLSVRRIGAGRSVVLRRNPTAYGWEPCYSSIHGVELAGTRTAWYEGNHGPDYFRRVWEWSIKTASLADRRTRTVHRGFGRYEGNAGGDVTSLSGDAGTLAYGWARHTDHNGCDGYDECEPDVSVTGGDARRIVGSRAVAIPGTPPTSLLSASSGRVAFTTATGIDVRNAVSGDPVASIATEDRVLRLALSRATLAAAVSPLSTGDAERIEVYDVLTGEPRRTIAVRASSFDVEGARVAFVAGPGIWVSENGAPAQRVWRGTGLPHSLSLDGNRLVWAVHGARRDRVLALKLAA